MNEYISKNSNILENLRKIAVPKNDKYIYPSVEDISNFEISNHIKLPEDLKTMLLFWGGFDIVDDFGENEDSRLIYPLKNVKFGERFYDINCLFGYEFIFNDFNHSIHLPKSSIHLTDYDGGSIFMSLSPEKYGQIFSFQDNYNYITDAEMEILGDITPCSARRDFNLKNHNISYFLLS